MQRVNGVLSFLNAPFWHFPPIEYLSARVSVNPCAQKATAYYQAYNHVSLVQITTAYILHLIAYAMLLLGHHMARTLQYALLQ